MISDCHTHILPRMDDGSRSVEESLQMLREESRQGVERVIFTPHFYAQQNSPAEFIRRRDESWALLRPHLEPGLPRLSFGAEVQYFEGICRVELEPLLCQEERRLLLEMPFCRWSERMVQDAMELSRRSGMEVMLAHIERYLPMQPAAVWPLLRQSGIQMQVNADFFLRWQSRRKALSMLRRGEIQFLASDCHNMERRPPNLGKALALLRAKKADHNLINI